MKDKKQKTALKITMGIALALVLIGVVNLAIYAFYTAPKYKDFCGSNVRAPTLTPEDTNLTQHEDIESNKLYIPPQEFEECSQNYDTARDHYNQNAFYILVLIGLILSVAGLFITHLSFQITGIGAGVILMMEGALRNLQDKIPAFIAFALAFVILALVVWRKVK